jgi:molybdopterin-guanine dinucleotide biosynthesis protein A
MGRNKALLKLGSRTLLEITASAVCEAAGNATIVGPPDAYPSLGFPVIPDRQPHLGPLAGIETALFETTAGWNLIVACDMPGLTPPVLRRILDEADAQPDAGCILPVGGNGFVEPLCAAYHKRMLPVISQALASGIRKVTEALPPESVHYLPALEDRAFQNVNTPDEWRRLIESR